MVYLHYMRENKKHFIVTLLIAVYALLVFQEVALNQVFCHKKDGPAELELCFFTLDCPCKDSHSHAQQDKDHFHGIDHDAHCTHHHPEPLKQDQKETHLKNNHPICCDHPLNSSWLERTVPQNDNTLGAQKQNISPCPELAASIDLTNGFTRFFSLMPLSKFLEIPEPTLTGTTILIC
ncbi:MAG: hypothetical protein GY765_14835 [bacterium]|nr:hypothetical protein [bacterium]